VSVRAAFIHTAIVTFVLGLAACGSSSKGMSSGSAGKGGGGAGAGGHASAGSGGASAGADGGAGAAPSAGMSGTDGSSDDVITDANAEKCEPIKICQTGGGNYCGKFPDGCGGILDCGSQCPVNQICGADHLCYDPNCKPMACSGPGYQWCGTVGDGCNHAQNCPDCTSPKTCMQHVCQ
jgi:hypothetical protein